MATYSTSISQARTNALYKAFGWMFVGLAVSAAVAYWTAATPAAANFILGNPITFFGLIILELALVAAIGFLIGRISAGTATTLFLIYAALNGLTLSSVVLAYAEASLAAAFGIAAGMFGLTALYGYATRRDLSKLGSILFMGLIGLILAFLVNAFLRNDAFSTVLSIISVVIFTGLTAYDVQKIKNMDAYAADGEIRSKQAIFGALMLYIDFVNIFLSLLNITGREKK